MMRMKSAMCLCWIMCLCFLMCYSARGQSATATLSGTVTDEAGAVVPGANITVKNTATGIERQAVTNEQGSFVVPLLPPSNYTVAVNRDGFAPAEITEVILNVNDQRSLNIQLKVGQVGGEVTVTTETLLVDESPSVSTTVDRQFVENQPLNGRSFNALLELTPGTVLTRSNANEPGQLSVNGQRADANYFTVDGVSANIGVSPGQNPGQSAGGALPATTAFGGTNNLVSVDALQEFKVQTSTFAPEFGRTPGAQVQIATRSGTNDFNGSLFEYFRNDALDANDFFANRARLPKPALRQNDFGGVIGGPLYFPRFGEGGPFFYNGKNKTFFFFSYEGLRLRQPQFATTRVPSLNARANAPTAVQALVRAFPLPNGATLANELAEFNATFSNPSTLDATSLRIDHNINSRISLFGRYNYAPSESSQRGAFGRSLNNVSIVQTNTQTLTLGTPWAVSKSIANDFRFNWSKTDGSNVGILDDFGGAVVPSDANLFPSGFSSANGQFALQLAGVTNGTFFVGNNADNEQNQLNFVDNLTVIAGDHQLKFGFDYRHLTPEYNILSYNQQLIFTGVFAPGAGGAPRPGTLLSGRAFQVIVQANQPSVGFVFENFSAYGQDTWRPLRRLTLTYGLRWDVNPAPRGKDGKDPFAVTGLDSPSTIALSPIGTPLYKTTYNNFAPRFGASYQLFDAQGLETVLRGGVGLFYDLGTQAAGSVARAGNFPFGIQRILAGGAVGIALPLTAAQALPPAFNTTTPVTSNISVLDPDLQLPRVTQFNLSVEQSLGQNQTVSASYVGAIGRRLLLTQAFVRPNPNFTQTVFATRNVGESDYHALQLQFQRRLTNGLQALVSYTFSKSIDNASTDNASLSLFRGVSDFDVRHSAVGAVTYLFPGPKNGRFQKALLGGWATDFIFRYRTALPIDVIAGTQTINGSNIIIRPDSVSGVPLYLEDSNAPGGRRVNPAAFALPPADPLTGLFTRQGNLGRNALRGFPARQIDLALRKQFDLTERVRLQLRAEFFNLFNTPNFGDPDNVLAFGGAANPTFGLSTQSLGRSLGSGGLGGGFSPLYQIGGPRSGQLALRIMF